MAATAMHKLTLNPMRKCSNAFFSETTNMIKAKLSMSCGGGHLEFSIGIKKQKLCRGPSKCFFSETTWTIETKLPRNDHWKVLYKVSVFYADRTSKMAATAMHKLTLNPMRKCSKSNVKLSPAVAAILNFISEQKT
jgi:hypothetical protein